MNYKKILKKALLDLRLVRYDLEDSEMEVRRKKWRFENARFNISDEIEILRKTNDLYKKEFQKCLERENDLKNRIKDLEQQLKTSEYKLNIIKRQFQPIKEDMGT